MKENASVTNRSTLLTTALTLFTQRGYDAVGVREIVEQAGLTKPTLYYYFSSKKGLLAALLDERLVPFLEQLGYLTQYRGDLPESLQEVVRLYFNYAQQQPLFFQLLLSLEIAPRQSEAYQTALPFLNQQRTALESLFQQAAGHHGNLAGRHQWHALGLLSYIQAVIRWALSDALTLSDQLVWQIVQQFSYGIYS